MKTFLSFILAIVLGLNYAAGAASTGVQVDSATHILTTPHANFFSQNADKLMSTVGPAVGARFVIFVSEYGDDNKAEAAGNLANKVFKTIGRAFSNAPNDSIIQIMPGQYPMTPAYFPASAPGIIPSPMVLRNKQNVTISAYGAKITGPGHFNYLALTGCKDVTIAGLTFDCSAILPNLAGPELTLSYVGTLQAFGVNENIKIKDCTFNNATDQAITTSRLQYGLTVEGCKFFNIGCTNAGFLTGQGPASLPWVDGTPISGFGSRTIVRDCYFNKCYRAGEWDEASGDTAKHSGIQFVNNVCSNLMDYGIAIYSPTPASQNIENILIADNIFHYAQDGSGIDTRTNIARVSAGVYISTGRHGIIRNNFFSGFYDDSIQLNSAGKVDDWLIDGNFIEGTASNVGSSTNGANRGIRIASGFGNRVENVTITRNHIRNLGGNGIYASGANVVVDGNHLVNVSRANALKISPDQGYRFFVECYAFNSSNIVFRNNYSFDERTGPWNYALGVSQTNGNTTGRIIWGKGNVSINPEYAINPFTGPFSVHATAYAPVYIEGRQILTTLVDGVKVVPYPLAKANSYIRATCQVLNGTPGVLYCSQIVPGTSFTITSTAGAADDSQIVCTIESPDTY